MPRNLLIFAALLFTEIWLAHALVFFVHEYAHSFMAWAFGYKANPFVLHFGELSAGNLLAQIEIDENVDYGPMFASSHGSIAALVAAAGVLSAMPLYLVAVLGYRAARGREVARLFLYLMGLMCVGNYIDYVPLRTFSPEGDMHTLASGLNVSPWVILVGLGLPFLFGVLHFFLKLWPSARQDLFPTALGRQRALLIVSTFLFFVFFGAAGLETGVGPIANALALVSIFGAFPIVTIVLWPRRAKPEPS